MLRKRHRKKKTKISFLYGGLKKKTIFKKYYIKN